MPRKFDHSNRITSTNIFLHSSGTVTVTLFDASLIPTPTNLPPLPTGTFAVSVSIPEERKTGCLADSSALNAWSCNMPQFAPPLQLGVKRSPRADNGVLDQAWLLPPPQDTQFPVIRYGVQPPTISMRTMDLVADHDDINSGPAWHFQALYDKLVILQEDKFPPGRNVQPDRRRNSPSPSFDFRHRDEVQPYERPWYCYWNDTFIEVYVYATKDASTYATAFPTTATASPSFTSTATTFPPEAIRRDFLHAPSAPTPAIGARSSYDQEVEPNWFPLLVKIEERRVKDSPQPYCQQMQILENGGVAPGQSREQPIIIPLQENPPPEEYPDRRRSVLGRSDPIDSCHCQWEYN